MVDEQIMQIHSLTQLAELNGLTVQVVSTDGDAYVCRCVSTECQWTNKLIKVVWIGLTSHCTLSLKSFITA